MRRLASAAPVGRLGTVDADGTPHLVPVCFSLVDDVVYTSVDHKPKRTSHLKRLSNVRATGAACLLVDYYDDDWSQLWWVRLDGRGRLVEDPAERGVALDSLAAKYRQYAERRPTGPVIAVDTTGISGWSAATG
ncbi:MAG: hypothetical protein QOC80_289 [Frankiaceae bacterium]|nr:hypothetical protein [Frankiaceae bacterium]